MAFLYREYRFLAIFVVLVAALIAVGARRVDGRSAFAVGAACSILAGLFWNESCDTSQFARTSEAARTGGRRTRADCRFQRRDP